MEIKLTKSDKILEILSWCFLILLWIITLVSYQFFSDKIPVHFNFEGVADTYGEKEEIFTLPVVATIIFLGLTYLNKFPHHFNYLSEINELNALEKYRSAARLIRSLKLVIVIIFGMIVFHIIQTSEGEKNGLGIWLVISIILIINIPTLYYLITLKWKN